MIRVGIPRALLYYEDYPAWQTFFKQLGAETVVSPPTSQAILAEGCAMVVTDTCLPVKVFCGHIAALADKCDYLFIPVVRSVKHKIYNCSKFLGLPDMTKAVFPECPPILEIEIDINQGKRKLYQAIYKLGRHFTWNPFKVREAATYAWQARLKYRELMSHQKLIPLQAIEKISSTPGLSPKTHSSCDPTLTQGNIALIGHPYLLYDEHINHRLIHRLEQAHYTVLTPEMVTTAQLELATARRVGRAYWTYEEEVVGAGAYYLESGVDGVIGIMTFGCGPDSLMMEMVRRQAARLKTTPFMSLTVEEHTAETGVITRLEAFLDMIQRKKRRQVATCV
jgi:predicted nucleotide-binding protein (sugar kinase/HSP70/actin superfamily)